MFAEYSDVSGTSDVCITGVYRTYPIDIDTVMSVVCGAVALYNL